MENRCELAIYLHRQTSLHLLTDDPLDRQVSFGLLKFFKGKNAIEFYELWERVFTFFLVAKDTQSTREFAEQLKAEIHRVGFGKEKVAVQLKNNLRNHLELCQAMANALLEEQRSIDTSPLELFRRSNLIRHHFVRLPLLNYTNYTGSLLTGTIGKQVKQDIVKFRHSPRYVHFDECLLLANSGILKSTQTTGFQRFQMAMEIYEAIDRSSRWGRMEIPSHEGEHPTWLVMMKYMMKLTLA